MINLVHKQNPMPEQIIEEAIKNFFEVATGYTEEQAIAEAMRCLKCRKRPCVSGCPVNVKIPDFIAKVAEGQFEEAYQIITQDSSLPAVCSRVCPQEHQCQGNCVHGHKGEPVAIGRLERFVADRHRKMVEEAVEAPKANGHKIAVIGSGPAGLACAGDLVNMGYEVTVFEALAKAGGVLVYGIPTFVLPKDILANEVAKLEAKGVKFVTDSKISTIDDLMAKEGFEAVFIGTGAEVPTTMGIPGEDLKGVMSANDYLMSINLSDAECPTKDEKVMKGDKIAIIGGGNVAIDAARCAKRMGASEVYIVYRRSIDEMPARRDEIKHTVKEDIEIKVLTNPVKVVDDGKGNVKAIECVEMELGEEDASGRRKPIEKKGSNFQIPVDMVVMAIGTTFDKEVVDNTKLDKTPKGGIATDEATTATSKAGVFAGGDVVTGPATVVKAMGAGRKAAKAIDKYITEK